MLIDAENNGYPFENNIDYKWEKFLQERKMSKSLIGWFFSNLVLVLI